MYAERPAKLLGDLQAFVGVRADRDDAVDCGSSMISSRRSNARNGSASVLAFGPEQLLALIDREDQLGGFERSVCGITVLGSGAALL